MSKCGQFLLNGNSTINCDVNEGHYLYMKLYSCTPSNAYVEVSCNKQPVSKATSTDRVTCKFNQTMQIELQNIIEKEYWSCQGNVLEFPLAGEDMPETSADLT